MPASGLDSPASGLSGTSGGPSPGPSPTHGISRLSYVEAVSEGSENSSVSESENSSFLTPGDGRYRAPPERDEIFTMHGLSQWSAKRLGAIRFLLASVKANGGVRIGLFPNELHHHEVDTSGPFYEVVLGGWSNRRSAIRRSMGGKSRAEVKGPGGRRIGGNFVLDPEAFCDFWISVDEETGRVAMGWGHNIKDHPHMTFIDNRVLVPENFAVMSEQGSQEGHWHFADAPQDELRPWFKERSKVELCPQAKSRRKQAQRALESSTERPTYPSSHPSDRSDWMDRHQVLWDNDGLHPNYKSYFSRYLDHWGVRDAPPGRLPPNWLLDPEGLPVHERQAAAKALETYGPRGNLRGHQSSIELGRAAGIIEEAGPRGRDFRRKETLDQSLPADWLPGRGTLRARSVEPLSDGDAPAMLPMPKATANSDWGLRPDVPAGRAGPDWDDKHHIVWCNERRVGGRAMNPQLTRSYFDRERVPAGFRSLSEPGTALAPSRVLPLWRLRHADPEDGGDLPAGKGTNSSTTASSAGVAALANSRVEGSATMSADVDVDSGCIVDPTSDANTGTDGVDGVIVSPDAGVSSSTSVSASQQMKVRALYAGASTISAHSFPAVDANPSNEDWWLLGKTGTGGTFSAKRTAVGEPSEHSSSPSAIAPGPAGLLAKPELAKDWHQRHHLSFRNEDVSKLDRCYFDRWREPESLLKKDEILELFPTWRLGEKASPQEDAENFLKSSPCYSRQLSIGTWNARHHRTFSNKLHQNSRAYFDRPRHPVDERGVDLPSPEELRPPKKHGHRQNTEAAYRRKRGKLAEGEGMPVSWKLKPELRKAGQKKEMLSVEDIQLSASKLGPIHRSKSEPKVGAARGAGRSSRPTWFSSHGVDF